MKHESYIQLMGDKLGLPGATHAELEAEAKRRMEAAGYRVLLDRMTDHRFRVRVQGATFKYGRYNVATTSTSRYPILAAFEKWQSRKGAEDA